MAVSYSQGKVVAVVLLVEDSEVLRENIQEILEPAGFLVLPAANAEQALQLAQSCAAPIDLLLTNLYPAGMPGPDLAGLLKERSPSMGVIYSSANPLGVLEVRDPVEVVSAMLPRPFSKETLLNRVNALLPMRG